MDIQEDKDFAALPEVAKLYQACKERDLTIAEREYLKGARDAWQASKAQAVPNGFVLVPKKSIEHWYLDEGEYLWMDEPDNWLCDMDVGDVQEVEHKEHIVT